MSSPVIEKIEQLIEPVAASLGCELVICHYGTHNGRKTLQVLVDKPGGLTLSDCKQMSELLGPLLDVEDLIQERYDLEISSPGLDRPLKRLTDFERFAGRHISLQTKLPIENRSRFKGLLKGVLGQNILIEIDQKVFEVPHVNLDKARLEVDWDQVFKKSNSR